jgi:hypothetical protein
MTTVVQINLERQWWDPKRRRRRVQASSLPLRAWRRGSRPSVADRASEHFFFFFSRNGTFGRPVQTDKTYLFFIGADENYLIFIGFL